MAEMTTAEIHYYLPTISLVHLGFAQVGGKTAPHSVWSETRIPSPSPEKTPTVDSV